MFLILDDRDRCLTAAGFLTTALRQSFPREKIVTANAPEFLNHLNETSPDIIVIPEIRGETNFYPKHVGYDGKQLLKHQVYTKGALYFGLCAGGYTACSHNFYQASHGEQKERFDHDLWALSPYHAKGPIKPYARPMLPMSHQEKGHSCVSVPIEFLNSSTRHIEHTYTWYENGPFFHDNGRDIHNSDTTQIIARYRLEEQRPVAAFKQVAGKGKLLLSGVLPHLSETNFQFDHPLWLTYVAHINEHLQHRRNQPHLR